MPFIIAKTVTYVSSLTVTYVTTLYIVASRQVGLLRVWLNGKKSDVVPIRPTYFLIVGLHCAGGYDPPLQCGRSAVRIRRTWFFIVGLYCAGG